MIFWVIAGAMTLAAVALLLWPLLRRSGDITPRAAYDITVYRDQLAEVKRDLEHGVLTADQAEAARVEIERRILATSPGSSTDTLADSPPARARGAAAVVSLALTVMLPALALALYAFTLGSPGTPSLPFAERERGADPAQVASQDMAPLIDRLAQRLAQQPGDPQGWLLLARSYESQGRFGESAEAYAQAITQGLDEAPIWAARGEMLIAAANGIVVPAATQAFATALERDPGNLQARYYSGLAQAQGGRLREAMDTWLALLGDSPADASWRGGVISQIKQVANDLGIDVASLPLGNSPKADSPAMSSQATGNGAAATTAETTPNQEVHNPTEDDVKAASEMTEEDRNAFIRTMVGQLAARMEEQPENLDGWLRLANAYRVLEETDKARDALNRAENLAQNLPAQDPRRAAVKQALEALPPAN